MYRYRSVSRARSCSKSLPIVSSWLGVLAVVNARVLGVAPELQSRYSGSIFNCFDGVGSFPASFVNDESCDCKDGSDEPATGACAGQDKTFFYCHNEGSVPRFLYASRVGDGICDCCDGSDEAVLVSKWQAIACANVCAEQGQHEQAAAQKYKDMLMRALEQKEAMITTGHAERERIRSEMRTLAEQLPALERNLEDAGQMVDDEKKKNKTTMVGKADIDAAENKKKVSSQSEDAGRGNDEEAKAPDVSEYTKWMDGAAAAAAAGAANADESKSTIADSEMTVLRPAKATTLLSWSTMGPRNLMRKSGKYYHEVKLGDDSDELQSGFLTESFRSWEDQLSQEELEGKGVGDDEHGWAADGVRHQKWHVEAAEAQWPKAWERGDIIGHAIDIDSGRMEFSLNGEWVTPAAMSFQSRGLAIFPAVTLVGSFSMHISSSSWKFLPADDSYKEWGSDGVITRPYIDESESTGLHQELNTALQIAEEAVKKNKAERDRLQHTLDFLTDDRLAFASLIGKEIETHTGAFRYKIKFFETAKQDFTLLGKWAGWSGPTTASFAGGENCWQGPSRRITVNFECGLEESLGEIAEPSRCVYEGTVVHPAACSSDHFENLSKPRIVSPREEL